MITSLLRRIYPYIPDAGKRAWRKTKYVLMKRKSSQEYWDFAAATCSTWAILSGVVDEKEFWKMVPEKQLMLDLDLLHGSDAVINIGCGIGRIENAIKGSIARVVGVDVSKEMIRQAKEKVVAPNVEFHVVDGRSLNGIPSGEFDLCVSFLVFQHMPREFARSYFTEVARVLRPEGRFFFQIPVSETPKPEPPPAHPFGMRWYRREEVERMLSEAGFVPTRYLDLQSRDPQVPFDTSDRQYFLALRSSNASKA